MAPIEVGPPQSVGAVEIRPNRAGSPAAATAVNTVSAIGQAPQQTVVSAAPVVETSQVLDPGAPPVDKERVEIIRKAVETGNYPVVPARIADAMIAAGMLLRSAE